MNKTNIVYSTDTSLNSVDETEQGKRKVYPNQQHLRLHLDRKGGGKIVTIVKGLSESKESIENLARDLKRKCGVGGAVKNNEILIQGSKRDLIQQELIKKGYNVKLSGG